MHRIREKFGGEEDSGKSPYGTPDRGGFTGWVRYGVGEDIKADVRAFAQSVTGPDALAAGSSATLGGELVQLNGVATGTRRVPLRYPMSVRWTGSKSLQVGGSVDDARRRQGRGAEHHHARAHRGPCGSRHRHG